MPIQAQGWFFVAADEPLDRRDFTIEDPGPGEAVVRVSGCGLCHTDLGFYNGSVPTRHELPLILGHEISGTVQTAGPDVSDLVGKQVIVPAVMPCGECDLCRAGLRNICKAQVMPGNDMNGGFATHIKVPARFLCALPKTLSADDLWPLSVVADAVTTPLQAIKRSGLKAGDVAVVVGCGGIGSYAIQLAGLFGARVVAVDVDDGKLEGAKAKGASLTLNATAAYERGVKGEIRKFTKAEGLPSTCHRIFECSGTGAGQKTAFGLLNHGATLSVVGFTMDKIEIRLSNLMAFDAKAIGNWGCDPVLYPEAVDLALEGRLDVRGNVEKHALADINQVFADALAHRIEKRAVLVP
ncbi:MAG: 6-hydroxycyclohex-1-ene-1-carbonyl-CoA dehydrogenase [Deltaproteobacteria bacterium]|nr:6-hydroxycyclohex-1-ene-1-carbonyl-CoA dehydrogenase [Deltaproteobacteria bacterium]